MSTQYATGEDLPAIWANIAKGATDQTTRDGNAARDEQTRVVAKANALTADVPNTFDANAANNEDLLGTTNINPVVRVPGGYTP
jgi:hypothetical protein